MSREQALTTPRPQSAPVLAAITRAACEELQHKTVTMAHAHDAVTRFKGELIKAALAETGGNMCAAARMLHLHRNVASRWREMA